MYYQQDSSANAVSMWSKWSNSNTNDWKNKNSFKGYLAVLSKNHAKVEPGYGYIHEKLPVGLGLKEFGALAASYSTLYFTQHIW